MIFSNPAAPDLVRFYDTYPLPNGSQYRGAWGVYPFLPSGNILLSDMQTGLYVFEGMGDSCHSQNRTSYYFQACTTTSAKNTLFSHQITLAPNPATDQIILTLELSKMLSNLKSFFIGFKWKSGAISFLF